MFKPGGIRDFRLSRACSTRAWSASGDCNAACASICSAGARPPLDVASGVLHHVDERGNSGPIRQIAQGYRCVISIWA